MKAQMVSAYETSVGISPRDPEDPDSPRKPAAPKDQLAPVDDDRKEGWARPDARKIFKQKCIKLLKEYLKDKRFDSDLVDEYVIVKIAIDFCT